MTVAVLEQKLNELKTTYTRRKTTLDLFEKQKKEYHAELKSDEKSQTDLLIMKDLLEKSSDAARKNGKQILSQTASSSVQMVMGNKIGVDIKLNKRSGVPTADLVFTRELKTPNGTEVVEIDPAEESGGVRDIVSFSTFMANGLLVGKDNKSPYFLDEPTKFVSEEYRETMAHSMKEVIDYTEKQAIVVTHDKEYLPKVANTVFELKGDENGNTQITRIL